TPAQSRFQDYLNVRNWRSGELNPATGALAKSDDVNVKGTEVTYNLNDGPESLVFVSAADSPLGREMLLAATPLAGRLTAYIIERGLLRGNDGSCPNTASCPYLSTTVGGTGLYRNAAGKSTIDPCGICIGAACARTGAWDTDAAENIAFDPVRARAFIASAESGTVQVVSVANPTDMTEIGTLNVGANLNTYCQVTTCIYQNMDYGGWASPCGYAPMLRITMNGAVVTSAGVQTSLLPLTLALTTRANGLTFSAVLSNPYYAAPFTMPGIVTDGGSAYSYQVDNTLDSPAKCQALCRNLFGCAYFSYEFEYQPAMKGWVYECFQKSEYIASQIPAGFTLESCHHYTMWESGPEWDMHFADQYWVGAGGPANCGTFRADSVQSVAVVNVPGFANAIVVAASPSEYHFAPGALSFYNAETFTYMGCAATGVKPEGIASLGSSVACIDEGSHEIELCGPGQIAQGRCTSAYLDKPLLSFNRHMALDQRGSMTMCQLTPAGGSVAIGCTVYQVNS
ncbi:hypothetical protein Ctob_016715, partial [Chrysochromulina tobinii]